MTRDQQSISKQETFGKPLKKGLPLKHNTTTICEMTIF